MKKVFFLFLLLGGPLWAVPNPAIVNAINGKVVDNEGQPLLGVSILVESTLMGTATNFKGEFSLNLKQGDYTLVFSFLGFATKVVSVQIPLVGELLVSLEPESILAEGVVVSGTRATGNMPVAYTNIPKEELKSLNSGFDIPFLLELTPSVVATSEGGTGVGNTAIRIRGTDMSRINVTVNGIPLNDPESQGVFWVNMPDFASSVDNVQVQRGVGTSTNGAAAFGATVNFQTTTLAPEPYANAEALAGSFGTLKTSIRVGTGLIKDAFSFESRYSKLKSNGYIDRGWSNHQSFFATGAWHGSKSLLRFNLIHGEQHTGITWEGTPSDSLQTNRRFNPAGLYSEAGIVKYYDNESDNYIQTHYQLHFSHQVSPSLSFNVSPHFSNDDGYYEQYKPNAKLNKYGLEPMVIGGETYARTDLVRQKLRDNHFYGVAFSARYRSGGLLATVGGGWHQYDGNHYGEILWTRVNADLSRNFEWYRNTATKTDRNIYAKATWEATPSLSVFGDLQLRSIDYTMAGLDDDVVSLDQTHQWLFFNPKTGLSYTIKPNSTAYFSVGIANREPTRADIKDVLKLGVSHTVSPERLYDFELGYSLKMQRLSLGANAYYMYYHNQLVLTGKLSESGYALMENVPESYRRGFELTWALMPTKWFRWNGATTLSQNRIANFVEYVDRYDDDTNWNPLSQRETPLGTTQISFSPSVVASSQLRFEPIKQLGFSLISKHVGKQYLDNSSNENRMLSAYTVHNLKVDYATQVNVLGTLRVELFVNNLLNTKYVANGWVYRAVFENGASDYREDGLFPQAGTNFMARLAIEF